MQIDPQRRGKMPRVEAPVLLDRDGVRGWKVTLPGGRPLATPAVDDGQVFLGGGFGSYEFYSLDADTGQLVWQYQTSDDGPTAAIVEDGYVVFNTESCELEVLTTAGRPVWKEWLGDPLMSMPAHANGNVFMAYPDTRGDGQHYLACFDLRSGQRRWKTAIAGEIITAPVLAGDEIYFATLDGTLYCCRQEDGHVVWSEASNATSSPVVVQKKCYFSQRKEEPATGQARQTTDGALCATRIAASGDDSRLRYDESQSGLPRLRETARQFVKIRGNRCRRCGRWLRRVQGKREDASSDGELGARSRGWRLGISGFQAVLFRRAALLVTRRHGSLCLPGLRRGCLEAEAIFRRQRGRTG